jgi:hypothetical protein
MPPGHSATPPSLLQAGRKKKHGASAFSGVSMMKSRENLVRLKQFQVNEKRRQLSQLDMMIAEFDRMATELEIQIAAEEKKAGITDINHFAYPTFATAARLRRDNLKNSQNDLISQKSVAEAILAEAEAELSKAELLESRDPRHRDGDGDMRSAMIG